MRRMKKYAIRIRIAAASPVSTHRSRRSGSRDSGGRGGTPRPPPGTVPGAISGPADGLAVALQAVHLGLRLRVQIVRELRVLHFARNRLALALGVVQPRLDAL